KNETLGAIKEYHKREPLHAGIGREEIRERIFASLSSEVFKTVVDRLVSERLIAAERDILRLASHQVALTGEDEKVRADLESKFKTAGFQALTYDEASRDIRIDANRLRKIFQILLNERRLVRVGEFVFHSESIDALIGRIKSHKAVSSKLDVAMFKEMTGLSRK